MFKMRSSPLARAGHNSRNESHVGLSYAVSLKFEDQYRNEIKVGQLTELIEFWVRRETNLRAAEPTFVNATYLVVKSGYPFIPMLISEINANGSLHVQLIPTNRALGYMVVVKFGETSFYDKQNRDYDDMQLFCPSTGLFFIFTI